MWKNRKQIAFLVCLLVVIGTFMSACDSGQAGRGKAVAQVGDTKIGAELVSGLAAMFCYLNYQQYISTLEPGQKQVLENDVLINLIVVAETVKNHLKAEGKELDQEAQDRIETNVEQLYTGELKSDRQKIGVRKSDVTYYFEVEEYFSIYNAEVIEADPVTDEEIQKYYDENPTEFVTPASVQASHILMMDAEHGETTRAAIEAVLEKARAGEDFAELAKEYSEDSSAESGGDVGWVNVNTQFVQEFKDAALALTVGGISEVVETVYGFHIIKVTDSTEEAVIPLADVTDRVRSYLESEKTNAAFLALKEATEVQYFIEVDPETGEPSLQVPQEDGSGTGSDSSGGTGSDGAGTGSDPSGEEPSGEEPSGEEPSGEETGAVEPNAFAQIPLSA